MSWRRRVFAAIVAAALLCGGSSWAQVERQPSALQGPKLPKPHLETRDGPELLPEGKLDGPVKQPIEAPVDLPPATTAEGKIQPKAPAPLMNQKKMADPAAPPDDLGNQIGPTIGFGPGSENASGKAPGSGRSGSKSLVEKFKALLADEGEAENQGQEDQPEVERQKQLDRYKLKPSKQSKGQSLAPP